MWFKLSTGTATDRHIRIIIETLKIVKQKDVQVNNFTVFSSIIDLNIISRALTKGIKTEDGVWSGKEVDVVENREWCIYAKAFMHLCKSSITWSNPQSINSRQAGEQRGKR